ncbi:MAG: hypothetical protein NDI82_04600 [Anaeromyxobacteraceae bacterium]|nr:hypothetical protein [Anaeromyxobacteraceae bacterium]
MTQPARPDPLAAAARVTGAAKDLATDLTEGFRKSDRGFKLRTAVVGTWVLLALMSVWIACPPSGPSNALGAVARLDTGGIMGNQVLVQNESKDLWTDVVLTLDDGWRLERRTVRGGDRLVLSVSAFTKDGQGAPSDLKPRQLTIECAEGKATWPLGAGKP